jgi:aminopeptidase N
MVLHMLRRLLGDEAFFRGLRRFYSEWRFKKAGTDDFRLAMEQTAGQDLTPFFEAWIYGSGIPRLKFSYSVDGNTATVKLEHRGQLVPVPVTVTLIYANGDTQDEVIAVTDQTVTRSIPLKGTLRTVEVNQDYAAVAEFER